MDHQKEKKGPFLTIFWFMMSQVTRRIKKH